ncbi:MAG: type I-A CRISPR-associated protein Cas7/Csa2 [Candidatus Nezhaarchaeales archaeon]
MDKLVWLSLSWRARVNVEALNMAEAIGNYVKHRRAPIAVYEDGKYVLRYVPAISGESIAHAYQYWIAEEASRAKLGVCDMCKRGEFVKHGSRAILTREGLSADIRTADAAHELEKNIISKCAVEDIGGFLVPTAVPVKRTSRFYVGYMIPALEDIKAATLDPQFHVRHAPSMLGREYVEAAREMGITEKGQAIYYVEVGSAIYTNSFSLDLSGIGYTSMVKIEEAMSKDERLKRSEVAIKALYYLVQGLFGAKRTRFQPDYELLSVVAAISEEAPFNVSPGHTKQFIVETSIRANTFKQLTGSNVKLYAYVREPGIDVPKEITCFKSFEELMKKLTEDSLTALKG